MEEKKKLRWRKPQLRLLKGWMDSAKALGGVCNTGTFYTGTDGGCNPTGNTDIQGGCNPTGNVAGGGGGGCAPGAENTAGGNCSPGPVNIPVWGVCQPTGSNALAGCYNGPVPEPQACGPTGNNPGSICYNGPAAAACSPGDDPITGYDDFCTPGTNAAYSCGGGNNGGGPCWPTGAGPSDFDRSTCGPGTQGLMPFPNCTPGISAIGCKSGESADSTCMDGTVPVEPCQTGIQHMQDMEPVVLNCAPTGNEADECVDGMGHGGGESCNTGTGYVSPEAGMTPGTCAPTGMAAMEGCNEGNAPLT